MKRFTLFFVFLFAAALGFAQNVDKDGIYEQPSPPKLYNNFSKAFPAFLSPTEANALEEKLEKFARETSNQVTVVVVDDLAGLEAWDYATRLGQKWGVGGTAKFDNGVVILIKPTGGAGQRDVHIAVGYGLEGAIPDATAKRITEEELTPEFKNGNYAAGINKATDVIFSLAKGEYDSKTYDKRKGDNAGKNWKYIVIAFVLVIILIRLFGGKGGGGRGFTGSSVGWGLGGMMMGGGRGWGGGSSGGGGGGGFGGFGGGGFGGGGAGGKW